MIVLLEFIDRSFRWKSEEISSKVTRCIEFSARSIEMFRDTRTFVHMAYIHNFFVKNGAKKYFERLLYSNHIQKLQKGTNLRQSVDGQIYFVTLFEH